MSQIRALIAHYEKLDRIEAIMALKAALISAERKIEADPSAGLPAPRPYPRVAKQGRAWVKAGRYWVAYGTKTPSTIVAVFYDAADIPGRV